MFKLNPAPLFEREVSFTVAGQDEPVRIQCTWRGKGPAGLAEYLDRAEHARNGAATLIEVLVGWSGPLDEAGHPLLLTPVNMAALLDQYPQAAAAFVRAYVDGCVEAYQKN